MKFRVATFDVATAAAPVILAPGEDGVGLTIARDGVPLAFMMEARPAKDRARAIDLAAVMSTGIVQRSVAAACRAEAARPAIDWSGFSLTIAICTKDRTELLERCLRALFDAIPREELACRSVDVLLVDNAPTDDGTSQLVTRAFPPVRYVLEPKPGLNFARNRALHEARGSVVAYLDDDVVVDRGWYQGLRDAWAADPDAGLYTGQVLPLELETHAQVLFELRGGFRRSFDRVHYGATLDGDSYYPCRPGLFGTGANMAVNRRAALEIGGFDEALDAGATLPGGGDLDMFYRAIRAGYRAVYEPSMLVLHQHRRDMQGLRRQYRESWGKAYMAFVAKSWRNDPPMRGRWTRSAGRWFAAQFGHLLLRVFGATSRPIDLIVHETWGGLIGILGAYDRSRRRADMIRSTHL